MLFLSLISLAYTVMNNNPSSFFFPPLSFYEMHLFFIIVRKHPSQKCDCLDLKGNGQ